MKVGEEAVEDEEEVAEMAMKVKMTEKIDEKEELVETEAVSPPPSEVADPAVPVVTDDVLTFELRVRVEDLPLPLRTALVEADEGEIRLPVELVLKTDAESSNQS